MKAILTFHSIDDRETVLSFSPTMFADMINHLLVDGISICALDKLMLPETDNAVTLTFDDGMQSVYKNALPILADAQVPAHIYLTTDYIGGDNRWPRQPVDAPIFEMMSWDEVEVCVKKGMYIENHTASHPDLRTLNLSEVEDECERADTTIEEHFGNRPEHFAYPYGAYNTDVSTFVSQRYTTCVTTKLLPLGKEIMTAELPRYDSYYLQNQLLYNHLFSPISKNYLFCRHLLRTMRRIL